MTLLEAPDETVPVFSWTAPELRRTPLAFRNILRGAAENWQGPPLVIGLPSGDRVRFKGSAACGDVRINVRDFRFIRRILMAGDVGFAEGFIAGEWETPDLPALLEALSFNFDRLSHLLLGNSLMRALSAVSHAFRGNSRQGARRNIEAHYDLGNAFYRLWLDRGMTYSSALFASETQSLEQAQAGKYEALARSMGLEASHTVLEIGCGWGGFAEFMGGVVGARVKAITISKAQHDWARRRIFEQGLGERVEVALVDYRDVHGQFDRVASIEMFEAVGQAYWPTYFNKIGDLLAAGGRAGLQIITIADELFEGYRARPDFIQSYIFPGGMLPSLRTLRAETAAAGLTWTQTQGFALDYARTLRAWRERFVLAWDEISGLGFDEVFRRRWLYYLGYCEAGFRTGRTDVVQLALTKA